MSKLNLLIYIMIYLPVAICIALGIGQMFRRMGESHLPNDFTVEDQTISEIKKGLDE